MIKDVLLKKLPGVDVDDDGENLVQREKHQLKFYVEGMDLTDQIPTN